MEAGAAATAAAGTADVAEVADLERTIVRPNGRVFTVFFLFLGGVFIVYLAIGYAILSLTL